MIHWDANAYVQNLATLLSNEVEGLRVVGLVEQRHPPALDRVLVEVEIERFEGQATGMRGTLDTELFASLVVSRRCDVKEAEVEVLNTTLEIATVLQALEGQGAIGPAQVLSVEPEPLEDALERRMTAWRIQFSQALRLQRDLGPEQPPPYQELWTSPAPWHGEAHRDRYERQVSRP